MVPPSVSAPPGTHRRDSRSRRAAAASLLAGLAGLAGPLSPGPAFAQGAPRDRIEWRTAFLVGTVDRESAQTGGITSRSGAAAELHLVVEGEKSGLPIYCTSFPNFRIKGRRIPERMTISPAEAGLSDSEVHWSWLRPTPDARDWKRTRVPDWDGRWSVSVRDLPGDEESRATRRLGTVRVAAAIGTKPRGGPGTLGTSGWNREPGWANPDHPPGFRLTFYADDTLGGRALSFLRLPIIEDATEGHVREKIAIRPVDLVLGAYAELAGKALPTSRGTPLTDPAWSWLFETLYADVIRRQGPALPVVTRRGRGVPWAEGRRSEAEGVRRGDVFLVGEFFAIAESDDGDGWLGNSDRVDQSAGNRVKQSDLEEVPGRELIVLRARDFRALRKRLTDAGYGPLPPIAHFDAQLERACREFQRDRSLPTTGVPDEVTRAALEEFLANLDSIDP